ncbi:hypothetical protein EC973_006899 [Apophysomyces ossiformis]|uniref:Polyketide synthase-like phosphopantetheine-binding domain-containing protein n=1 Tax=Apophysomyces ossiformis TaxID=679940 RepID=A0A8H7BUK9_9FUNG|nr:hypothetical protein EC973_006899 [Apophysomyces ossiformis]
MSSTPIINQFYPTSYKDAFAFIRYWKQQSNKYAHNVFARYQVGTKYDTLTYAEVDRLATNLACNLKRHASGTESVALLADHSVYYMICILAIMKLRLTLVALSTRNSEDAIANLATETNAKLILTTEKYSQTAANVASRFDDRGILVMRHTDVKELLKDPLDPQADELLDESFSSVDIEKIALVIHSSGSTAFPKPIRLSNRYLMYNVQYHLAAYHGIENKDSLYNETDVMFACLPLFHVFGHLCAFNLITVGGSTIFPEKFPPSVPDILDALGQNNATYFAAPPLILEQLLNHMKETGDYSVMQKLKLASFGGAPLKAETGQFLIDHGIKLRNLYGSTETNAIMMGGIGKDAAFWNSLRPLACFNEYCIWEPYDGEIKHLALRGDFPCLATGLPLREDGNYPTNDLWMETVPGSGYYTYKGRKDDTLIMENGEKTNPLPMEATIRAAPIVAHCVVLGERRQCTAALIELNTDVALRYDPAEMIAEVHKAVEEANKSAPSHSTILPQMVRILPLNKRLPTTDKGTVIRRKAIKEYENLIEKMYSDFLEGPKINAGNNEDVSKWSAERWDSFLVDTASGVLGINKSDLMNDLSQSLFDVGLNSLLSIQLRNLICKVVNVPQNFLFQHPSIRSMREVLQGGLKDGENVVDTEYQKTEEILDTYLKNAERDFGIAKNEYRGNNKGHVVLLTGATGSLGSFMLRDMLKDSTVKKIYCLVRGKENLMKRIHDGFEARCLDSSLLNSTKVEVLPMQLTQPNLGFSPDLYDRLKKEVTIVQHCAWLLDFNQPVSHYEKDCIRGLYNLLKFAYRDVNPMHVHFISSVSASALYGERVPEEPLPRNPRVTMPMGYAQSKFISEHLFYYLTREKNFPCYVERLGQVCGDSVHGAWNTSEQYPLMFIGGGQVMHKMPKLDTAIDWITVDNAASSILDIMLSTANQPANIDASIYHIVNPHPITWDDILSAMKSSGMQFDTVTPTEWVTELSKDSTNPAYKLMSFYEGNFNDKFAMPLWETEKTKAASTHLQKSPLLDASLFTKYLDFWRKVGFYQP